MEQVRQGKFKVIFGRNPLAASVFAFAALHRQFNVVNFFSRTWSLSSKVEHKSRRECSIFSASCCVGVASSASNSIWGSSSSSSGSRTWPDISAQIYCSVITPEHCSPESISTNSLNSWVVNSSGGFASGLLISSIFRCSFCRTCRTKPAFLKQL